MSFLVFVFYNHQYRFFNLTGKIRLKNTIFFKQTANDCFRPKAVVHFKENLRFNLLFGLGE